MMVALTPAFDPLIACASELSEVDAGLMVKLELPTVRVKLVAELIDVAAGSVTAGTPAWLSVVVDAPAVTTWIEYTPTPIAALGSSVAVATELSDPEAARPLVLAAAKLWMEV